jgi:hypothetical protein
MTQYFKFEAKKSEVKKLLIEHADFLNENYSCFLLNDSICYFISTDTESIDIIKKTFDVTELPEFNYDLRKFKKYECIGNEHILE